MKDKLSRVGVRSFGEILADLAGGDVEKRLTNDLAELVRAVEEVGKDGVLTIKLTVSRGPKTMHIATSWDCKTPKAPVEATAFFSDERGGLHVENPRQGKLWDPGRESDGGAS